MAEPKAAGGQSVDLIVKADEILELVRDRGELSVAEIAEGVQEPRSSVYRLIATLEGMGFVEPGPRGIGFQIGMRLFHMARIVADGMPIIAAARPAMDRLAVTTGETIFLIVPHDRQTALCAHRIDGARVQSMAVATGGVLPLHLGAGPLVLLAHDEHRETYVAEHSAELDVDELRRRLVDVRERGYAISDGDLVPGMAAIGAPVVDDAGRVVAALSIGGARASILGASTERIAGLVMDAAGSVRSPVA